MIKWFDSKLMAGLPELTNTQGDLVKVLTGLLVSGANSKPVTTVSYALSLCTLELGINHGFAPFSVVEVKGSAQASLIGKEFRVKAITETTISFDSVDTITTEVGLTVNYAPLGWNQHFASEGRSCYRSPDPRYPAYLRVDDTKLTGMSASNAKFATVEICEGMTDFDSATWQSPFNASHPLRNRASTASSLGWFKWYYAASKSIRPDVSPAINGSRRYMLIGDSTYFWLIIYPYKNSVTDAQIGAVYGFSLVDYKKDVRQALIATDGYAPPDTDSAYPTTSFINAYIKGGVAPLRDNISSTVATNTMQTTNVGETVTLSILRQQAGRGIALSLPIYLSNPTISAQFLGIGLSPNNFGDAVQRSNGNFHKFIDINQLYYLAIDLG